jgi:ribosomal protein S18 acetylase RimI-like enzyme
VESLTVRRAVASDEPFLREMQYEALFVPKGEAPAPPSVVDAPKIAHYYRKFGDRVGDVGWVAELGSGKRVGAAWVRLLTAEDPGFGYVDDQTPELVVAVSESYRGSGVGSTLLTELLSVVPRCCLSVDARNPALRLYERLGFVAVATAGTSLTMVKI